MKFRKLIFTTVIILLSFVFGYFFAIKRKPHNDLFEDILSYYPKETIKGTLMVDFTHDGNDDLLIISQSAMEIILEVYTIVDNNSKMIYKDSASDNHAGWRWYYLVTINDRNYIMQYIPEIWNGIGRYRLEIFYLDQNGQKELFEVQELPYNSIHISENKKHELLSKIENFKTIYEKWQAYSIPLITIGSDSLTGNSDNYIFEENVN